MSRTIQAEKPKAIYLKDYRPPEYRVHTANLHFELDETKTRVKSFLVIKSNYDRDRGPRPLVLDGKELILKYVKLDGRWQGLLNEVRDSHWMMAYGDHLKELGYASRKIGVDWVDVSHS